MDDVDPQLSIVAIEDDQAIAGLVQATLAPVTASIVLCATGSLGLAAAERCKPDVVIVDLGLPDADGLDVVAELRAIDLTLGIVCLTARKTEADRVSGFGAGADDYVTKPFSPAELLGRVLALGRRVRLTRPAAAGSVSVGSLTIDLGRREARAGGEPIELTPLEFDLLAHLMTRPGELLARKRILEAVWGHSWLGDSRTVDLHISQLRRKVGDAMAITTVRGAGYRLEPEPEPDSGDRTER